MNDHRFLVLDGLRGIAAFTVVWAHIGNGFGTYLPYHSYLAVDFFFTLSGFVIAYAYEGRIKAGLGFTAFAKRRLIRLYPMIFAASLLGALAYDPGWTGSIPELFCFDAATFSVLPLGLAYNASSFPVDIPVWSLFFELCANGVYWCAVWRQPSRAAVLGFLLVAIAGLAIFARLGGGFLGDDITRISALNFLTGFPRVAVSFTLGVLVFHSRLHERLPRLPDYLIAPLLAALFFVPRCAGTYDLFCALVAFPLLLALGAQARQTPFLRPFWAWCGALSYPLYVTHHPVLRAVFRLQGGWPVGLVMAVVSAWALLRWFDEPVRRRLARGFASAPPSTPLLDRPLEG